MTAPLRRLLDKHELRANAIAAKVGLSATSFQRWVQMGIPPHRVPDVAAAMGLPEEDLSECVYSGPRTQRANGNGTNKMPNQHWLRELMSALPPDQAREFLADFFAKLLKQNPASLSLVANNVEVVAAALADHFLQQD